MTEAAPSASGTAAGAAYDPGAHTVNEVIAYADAHPGEVDAILAAERAGKARTTLIEALGG